MSNKPSLMKDMIPNKTHITYKNLWMNILGLLMIPLATIGMPNDAFAFNNGADNFALVVTDSFGRPLENKSVELMIELTTGALDGQPQYAETHSKTTDAAGVATFAIGFGKATDPKYVFDNFDIAQGDNYLRVSVQEADGWRLLLKSQIPNVPELRKWLFANEKSNTVIAIMIVIWVGIVVYLLMSGRKLRRLEKQLAELKQQRSQSNG